MLKRLVAVSLVTYRDYINVEWLDVKRYTTFHPLNLSAHEGC